VSGTDNSCDSTIFAQRHHWGYIKGEIIFFTMINTIEALHCSQKHVTRGVENPKQDQSISISIRLESQAKEARKGNGLIAITENCNFLTRQLGFTSELDSLLFFSFQENILAAKIEQCSPPSPFSILIVKWRRERWEK
jgi:hypothetical protein